MLFLMGEIGFFSTGLYGSHLTASDQIYGGRFDLGLFRPGSFRLESFRPLVVSDNFGESFRPDFFKP